MMTNANLRYTYLYFRQYRLNTRNTIPNRIPMDAAVEKTTNSSKGMIRVFGCLSNWSDGTRPSQSNTQKIKQLKCCFRSCSVSILNQSTENCKLANMNQQSLQIICQHLLSSDESFRLVTSQLSQQCVVLVRSVHTLDVVHNIQKNFCAPYEGRTHDLQTSYLDYKRHLFEACGFFKRLFFSCEWKLRRAFKV